jgi:Flp pilus assembly protein TadG
MGAPMLRLLLLTKNLDCKGQSIVEIGLITPILLVALYVPADFGIAFFTAHLTQNAVREAARIAVSDPTPTNVPFNSAAAAAIKTEALNRLPARLTSQVVTVSFYASGAANCMQFIEVTAQGNYDYFLYQILRLFGANVSNSLPITRTSRQRYEFQPVTNAPPICTTVTVQST